MFLDTRSLAVEHVPMPSSAALVVIDSGISHRHAGGEYATRRAESFAAAAALGVSHLRDVEESALGRLDRLPPLLRRRARHVITENSRVLRAVAALKAADAVGLGLLFNASHASMRDDYATSTPEIDLLVSLAQHDHDVYGARMTGGGFGGAVVLLARPGCENEVATRVLASYRDQTGLMGRSLVPVPRDAATDHGA
jgi:galactokinase